MSYLQQVAAQREEQVKDLFLDLPIPTWTVSKDDRTPTLVARFKIIEDDKKLKKFLGAKRTPETDADFIINTARELYLYDPEKQYAGPRMLREDGSEDDRYVMLQYDSGLPMLFTPDLAEAMGVQGIATAREMLAYVFKGNWIAVSGFCGRVITWMQNTDAKVAEDLAGE